MANGKRLRVWFFQLPLETDVNLFQPKTFYMFELIPAPIDFVKSENTDVLSKINSNPSDLIQIKGSFSTCDTSYKFEIKSNGTGTIFYSDVLSDSEEFAHEVNLEVLKKEIEEAIKCEIELKSETVNLESSEIENIRQEVTAEKLEEFFWEEINQTLEDPFFRSFDDESEWGAEFYCERGSTADFEEFLELCILTEREISEPDDYLIIDSETDCEVSGFSDCSYWSERIGELVEIACGFFKPAGHRYDYNDGWCDRYSGYSMSCESISISLKESFAAPTREKMLAMIKLRKKLAVMGIAGDVIERLTAF